MNGVLIIDKPKGMTSHDVVLSLRRKLGIKKIGHAGTLDPMATGVLVVLIGSATKLSGNFISDDKIYEGALRLGIKTDTHDSEGKVLAIKEPIGISEEAIKDAFNSFCGVIEQVPPMVSAIKHKGKCLYKLARRGIEVERRPRKITIYDIKVKKIDLPDVWFFVHCSKGTYIRKLADDIGQKLGCGAHLTELRRTRSGRFSIKDAIPLTAIANSDKLTSHVIASPAFRFRSE